MTPPRLGDEDVTPNLIGGVGRDTSQRIELAVEAGVRRATGPQPTVNLRGGVSLGNWLTIIGLVLGVLGAGGAVSKVVFFSAAEGAALKATVDGQSESLKRIETKLDAALGAKKATP